MAQGIDSFPSKKHVCIFELERNGRYYTGDVVCTVCGVKLSSANEKSVNTQALQADTK